MGCGDSKVESSYFLRFDDSHDKSLRNFEAKFKNAVGESKDGLEQHHHHHHGHHAPPPKGKNAIYAADPKIATNVMGNFKPPGNIVQCYPDVPWLIKTATFHNPRITDFRPLRLIGKGRTGKVNIATTRDGKFLVIKSTRREKMENLDEEYHLDNEREILKKLACPFCVTFFNDFADMDFVYFAMEYAPGGELRALLSKKERFSAQEARFYMAEVLLAIIHIHELNYVYRDLKTENIMLDGYGHVKLCDFGNAIRTDYYRDGRLRTVCGNPAYLSPEQLDGKETNGYSKEVDWWAYGVMLYELLTGTTPFGVSNPDAHYDYYIRILRTKVRFPLKFEQRSKELITRLCHPDLNRRLHDPAAIKEHPYFSQLKNAWDLVLRKKLQPPFVPTLNKEGDSFYFGKILDASLRQWRFV